MYQKVRSGASAWLAAVLDVYKKYDNFGLSATLFTIGKNAFQVHIPLAMIETSAVISLGTNTSKGWNILQLFTMGASTIYDKGVFQKNDSFVFDWFYS